MEIARCMLKGKNLPNMFWLDAMMCSNYALNRCPTKALRIVTPYEVWKGHKPLCSSLALLNSKRKQFRCPCASPYESFTKRDLVNSIAHALIAIACDEEPVCHKDAFSNELWMQDM